MRLSISNIAWNPEEDVQVTEIMEQGLATGIEIAPTKTWPSPTTVEAPEAERYRKLWNDRGFEICAFQALLFGHPELTIFENEEARAATIEYLDKIIDLAAILGAKNLVFGSPKNRLVGNMPRDIADRIAVEFFGRVGKKAESSGICFCIEPNPAQYGCDFVNTSLQGAELVRAVGSPGFRLHLDCGAMTLNNENYEQAIESSFDCLSHFHISEPFLAPIGESGTDHKRIAATLRSLGYDGWVSIEMRSANSQSSADDRSSEESGSNLRRVESALNFAAKNYFQ
jgi:sugar phosphate isomerase/epimerase